MSSSTFRATVTFIAILWASIPALAYGLLFGELSGLLPGVKPKHETSKLRWFCPTLIGSGFFIFAATGLLHMSTARRASTEGVVTGVIVAIIGVIVLKKLILEPLLRKSGKAKPPELPQD